MSQPLDQLISNFSTLLIHQLVNVTYQTVCLFIVFSIEQNGYRQVRHQKAAHNAHETKK